MPLKAGEEEIPDSEYRAYQHFLTYSKWDHNEVLSKVCRDTSQILKLNKAKSKKPTGLIVDESAHLKKGTKSVAVGKQYAGVVGKVENCQVGVYASMVNDNRAGLVNERLFIPETWDRKIRDIFVTQDETTNAVISALKLTLIYYSNRPFCSRFPI
ncbi:MAG: transposase [Bacteroidetes bacterium]|nr:transposase [Bacteroidota bacterium]